MRICGKCKLVDFYPKLPNNNSKRRIPIQKILSIFIFFIILINSTHLFSNGPPPEKPSPQPPVVTPYVPREAPPIRHNPGHR